MTLIEETVEKERNRIEYMLSEYERRLLKLPKGTLTETHRGDKTYYYLKFRNGEKVVSQYVLAGDASDLQNSIAERKHIEKMIRELKKELKQAKKLGVKI